MIKYFYSSLTLLTNNIILHDFIFTKFYVIKAISEEALLFMIDVENIISEKHNCSLNNESRYQRRLCRETARL